MEQLARHRIACPEKKETIHTTLANAWRGGAKEIAGMILRLVWMFFRSHESIEKENRMLREELASLRNEKATSNQDSEEGVK